MFGLTDQIWLMAIAALMVGAAFNGGVVIWGTLLQRRVPPRMTRDEISRPLDTSDDAVSDASIGARRRTGGARADPGGVPYRRATSRDELLWALGCLPLAVFGLSD